MHGINMSVQRSETLLARRMRTTAEEIEAKEQELQKKEKQGRHTHTTWGTITLAYSSLGIIYGDIGTSPLYCFATTLYGLETPVQADVLGVASLIFWIMTLIVLVKYVLIVLQADDNGEGGTFALYSLLCRSIGLTPFGAEVDKSDCGLSRYSSVPGSRDKPERKGLKTVASCMSSHAVNRSMRHAFRHSRGLQIALLLTVVLATAMVVGDGILTPSISVMGAVDGLTVATDNISPDTIVGISCVVLVLLFVGQRYGTSMVGQAFAPVVIIWLSMNACLGIYNLSTHGGNIFRSLNPWLIVDFFVRNGHQGWLMLGGVMLCITGAEAMYSDLGHFTKQAVSLGFITFVYPCLMLTYWGQGAYLLAHPEHAREAFWKSVPDRLFWPFFVVAILASVVASQALISGAFSIMRQASALGLFPKMTIVHTGRKIEGQIYMPEVNYTLMVLCVAVTVGFQSTHSLGEAYGVAVMTVMTFTTLLVCLVMLMTWNLHPLLVALFVIVYLPLEGAFLSATLVKVPNGGWVALVVAAILGFFKMTWWWGTNKKHQHNIANKSHIYDILMEVDRPSHNKLGSFRCSMVWNNLVPVQLPKRQVVLVATGEPVSRMPGLGVYYSESSGGVPAVMQHVLETMPALYSSMVFMTVRFVALPTVDKKERFIVRRDKTISSCYHATVRYGYLDRVDDSQVFMEDLVQTLLQQLLEKRSVGSPGAAQRFINAIAAKATARSTATSSYQGDMEALAGGFATGVPSASSDGTDSSTHSIAQVLSAAAAAVNSMTGADNSTPSPGSACGVVSELLSQLTATDLLAILQPVRTTVSNRRLSISRPVPTSKLGSSTGLAAVAGEGTPELPSLGSVPQGEVLACITIKVSGETAVATTGLEPSSKQGGLLELTPQPAGLPRRESAKLHEDGNLTFGSAGEYGDNQTAQVACESAPAVVPAAAESSDNGEALRRFPSYWGQLQDAGKSAIESDDEEPEEEAEGEQDNGQQEELQQPQQHVAPIMVPAPAAISDIMSPVSLASNSSNDNTSRSRRGSAVGIGFAPGEDARSALVQLSSGQITALQEAVRLLEDYHRRWVHCVGRTTLKMLPGGRFAHKVALGAVYRFMATNSRQVTAAWNIPTNNLIELGMDVEV